MADNPDAIEKWKPAGVTEDNLIYASEEFVVFLRKNLDTDWITDDNFDNKLNEIAKNPDWGFITRNVTRLEAVPIDHLSNGNRLGFRQQLGTAVSLGLQEDFTNAKELLHDAEDFVTARNNEVARRWFLESSGIAALFALGALLTPSLWCYYEHASDAAGLTTFEKVFLCAASGALGAFLSIISRISKVPLDPAAGKYIHYLEGMSRIAAGVIAGPFLLFAIKLGVILPALDKDGIEAVALVGLVAGASERIFPSLIGKVESQASDSETNNDGKH